MLQKARRRLHCSLISWLSSGVFWAVLLGALALSVGSKSIINLAIEPISFNVSLRSLEGQIFPYPPGRLAITHSEHWASGGVSSLFPIGGGIITAFLYLAMTRRVLHHRIAYAGVGLFLAGIISNRGEVALFGHATDFLLIWPTASRQLGAIANFADFMVVIGLALFLLGSPMYRLLEIIRSQRAGAGPEPGS